jgi:hypothetical protein
MTHQRRRYNHTSQTRAQAPADPYVYPVKALFKPFWGAIKDSNQERCANLIHQLQENSP